VKKIILSLPVIAVLFLCFNALVLAADFSVSASTFEDLKWYILIDVTRTPGTFEGADFDKVITLENGLTFEFMEYHYTYAYRPSVLVWARTVELENGQSVVVWRLLIDDHVYKVIKK